MKSWRLHTVALLMMGSVLASLAWAEEIVFETYYPSASSTSGRFRDLAVGDKKNFLDKVDPLLTSTDGEGVALIQGALGIGISALPTAALQVEGNAIFGNGEGTDAAGPAVIRGANGIGTNVSGGSLIFRGGRGTGTGAGGDLIFETAAASTTSGTAANAFTEKMRVDSTGNVGIGTTDPTSSLAFGGDAPRAIQMERNTTGNSAGNSLTIQAGGATSGATDQVGGDLLLSSGISTGVGSSKISFQTVRHGAAGEDDRTPTTQMTILGNGKVGIGTMDPKERLHVDGIIIADRASTSQSAFSVRKDGIQKWSMFVDVNSSDLEFFEGDTSAPGADATRVVFKAGGNVGIGTADPTERLHIVDETNGPVMAFDKYFTSSGDDENAAPRIMLRRAQGSVKTPGDVKDADNLGVVSFHGYGPKGSGSSFQRAARIRVVAGGDWTKSSTPTIMQFFTTAVGSNDDTAERMRITADGKVGIGRSSPAATLDVNGTLRVGGRADFNGPVILNNLPKLSSSSLKTLQWGGPSKNQVSHNDLAELFPVAGKVAPGDVLAVEPVSGSNASLKLKLSQDAYTRDLVGVVSETPAIVFEGNRTALAGTGPLELQEGQAMVALIGRVEVNASLEGGPIEPGDPLTSASEPGKAMKANKAGRVIGIALESYTGPTEDNRGKILMFVNPGWGHGAEGVSAADTTSFQEILKDLQAENKALRERIEALEKRE